MDESGFRKVDDFRRGALEGYVRLRDVVPLATPFTVLIDPVNACNFKCTFCPTGDKELLNKVGRPLGVMPSELYGKIIDDIAGFPGRLKKLQLYKDGEPLLNKALPEMVALATERRVSEVVETTTNAALLDAGMAAALIDAELDAIRISVEHVHDAGYRQVTQDFADYERIRGNVATLFELRRKRAAPRKSTSRSSISGSARPRSANSTTNSRRSATASTSTA